LQSVEAKAEEVAGADVTLAPMGVPGPAGLGASSVLPALASLFRFGRPISAAHPLPLVTDRIAMQDRPGLSVAYRELPMPVPRIAAIRGSTLRIVETFEYLKPLEEPPFELLRTLMRLWQEAPAYFRFAAVTASVMLLLWAALPRGGVDTLVESRWSKIEDGIRSRAAVELEEDFQAGMTDWDGEGDWSRTWRLEKAGFVRPGRLALYEPSMKMEGYRVEFLVQVERQSVGWVYRAADKENYYAAKLTIIRPGPLPLLSLVRYPVIGGQTGPRVEIPIRVLLHENTPYRVQLKVNGVEYSTSIEGQLVDFWSDDRLKRGGVGFFGDAGSRARIYWMKLSQQDDFVGRVCAYFYPNPVQSEISKGSP
jgi:hypothetical protein